MSERLFLDTRADCLSKGDLVRIDGRVVRLTAEPVLAGEDLILPTANRIYFVHVSETVRAHLVCGTIPPDKL